MSVEGVGGKPAAISFPVAPATAAQPLEQQLPAVKPARRRSFERARPAPLQPPFVMTPAALAIQAGIAVLLHVGRSAAFAPGGRKTAHWNNDDAEREESPSAAAHDDPERLSTLRDQLAQLPAADIARLRELAEKARDTGFGFVVEPLELPAPQGPRSEAHLRLNPAEIDKALDRHGRIYAGELVNIPKAPPAQGTYQVIDAKSAEVIMSIEALRSYLKLFS